MKNELKKYDKTYQISRLMLTPLFKLAYHPLVLNKENIPSSGPVILCGNHLHVWDQVPVICSTNRTIHWMAKKEYFETKLAWMYKITGCIPVDRQGNASISKNYAEEYLRAGEVVGLFPEGTRNQYQVAKNQLESLYQEYPYLHEKTQRQFDEKGTDNMEFLLEKEKELIEKIKLQKEMYQKKNIQINEEEELLQFHFGAVAMARNTGAKIVPFAVNGDYKINNKNLVVSFGEAYSLESNDLELENNKLQNKISSLIKENKKIKRIR